MGTPSPKHTAEFKQKAVELYRKSGTTYAEVARGLGCDPGSLSDWVKKADAPRGGNPFQAAEENRRLKRVSVNAFFTIWGCGGNPGPFRVRRSGLGQHNGHGESSVSIGKVFKLCQENAAADNSSSPPRDWFSRKRSQPRGCPTGQTCRAASSEGGRRNMGPKARTRFPEAATPPRTRIARR